MEFTIQTIGSTIFQSIMIGQQDLADEFSIKMLTNNEIQGMLPFSAIRKDMDMELRYNITSLIPLSQLMQEPLSKNKVLNILRSIVSAVISVEEYMLDATGLVMDEEKIYVNIATGEAELMYLPVVNPYACDIIAFIKRLITCFQFDQNEDSGYVLQFINAFNSGSITTIAGLSDFILSIEKKGEKSSSYVEKAKKPTESEVRQNIPVQQAASIQPQVSPMANGKSLVPKQDTAPVMVPPIPEIPFNPSVSKPSNKEKRNRPSIFGKSKDKQQDKPKNKLFGGKNVQEQKIPAVPEKAMGFAIPGVNDLSGLPLSPQEELAAQGIPLPSTPMPSAPAKVGSMKMQSVSPASEAIKAQPIMPVSGIIKAQSAGNLDYGNTIMINQNNSVVTVMLDENGLDSNEPVRASITRVANNQKMYMDKEVLKIGKESDYVDFYIGNNPTISRAHADIIRNDGKYYIRDNNSKNHTYVNGEMIPPSQLIPISNNTKIMLSNEELIFQLM